MAGIDRRQEAVWAPILEAIWRPDRNDKYLNGSKEYWYFHNVFHYLDDGYLLARFENEVKKANGQGSGFLEWKNVWGESASVSYLASIEKVFALLYKRRSTDPSGVNQRINKTKEIVDYRKKDMDRYPSPDAGHKKIYKWWVCFYALLQILQKFGNEAVTKTTISSDACRELSHYHYYDVVNDKIDRSCTKEDIKPFQNRL